MCCKGRNEVELDAKRSVANQRLCASYLAKSRFSLTALVATVVSQRNYSLSASPDSVRSRLQLSCTDRWLACWPSSRDRLSSEHNWGGGMKALQARSRKCCRQKSLLAVALTNRPRSMIVALSSVVLAVVQEQIEERHYCRCSVLNADKPSRLQHRSSVSTRPQASHSRSSFPCAAVRPHGLHGKDGIDSTAFRHLKTISFFPLHVMLNRLSLSPHPHSAHVEQLHPIQYNTPTMTLAIRVSH